MERLPPLAIAPRPDHPSPWVVILAGGCGSRLRGLTSLGDEEWVPKQYCSLSGGATLLQSALERAAGIAHRDRICVIVTEKHRRWWSSLLRTLPSRNILVQPEGRGTTNGILLPMLEIARRETDACVAIMPSDHDVSNEAPLRQSLITAARYSRKHPELVSLLGIEPAFPDPELGYILPGGPSFIGPAPVRRFFEKPSLPEAAQLVAAGSLWNAFIMVGAVRAAGPGRETDDSLSTVMRGTVRNGCPIHGWHCSCQVFLVLIIGNDFLELRYQATFNRGEASGTARPAEVRHHDADVTQRNGFLQKTKFANIADVNARPSQFVFYLRCRMNPGAGKDAV